MGAPVGRVNVPTDLAIDARDQLELGQLIGDCNSDLLEGIQNWVHPWRVRRMSHAQPPAVDTRRFASRQQLINGIRRAGNQDLIGAVDPGQCHLLSIGGQQRSYLFLFGKDHGGGTSGRSTFDQFRPLHH